MAQQNLLYWYLAGEVCISSSSVILLLVWKMWDHTFAKNNFGMQTYNSSHMYNLLKYTTTTDVREYKNLPTYPPTYITHAPTHGFFNNAFRSVEHEIEAT